MKCQYNEPISELFLPSIFDNNHEHFLYVFFLDNVSFVQMENHVLNKYRNNRSSISAYWLENVSQILSEIEGKEREREREKE